MILTVTEKTGHRASSVAWPTGAAVRRVGTRAPCGPRPGSQAHVLCATRAETGGGQSVCDEAPPARLDASRVGDDSDYVTDAVTRVSDATTAAQRRRRRTFTIDVHCAISNQAI